VNPANNILRATEDIGSPIRLNLPGGELVGQSANWPAAPTEEIIFTEYDLRTPEGAPYLKVAVAGEISELLKKLSRTRKLILVTGTLITLVITLLALYLVQRVAVRPLQALGDHLRRIREDKSNIGKQLAVTGGLEIAGLTTDFNRISNELRALYNTLENMAFSDPLTNMPNRALFYNRLDHAISETERYNTPFAVFMMDLDRFKNINDTLGHHIGDLLLQETGKRLQQVVRKSDTVARLGGDEFAIILPTIEHNESVNKAAEKIIAALSVPIMVEGHSLNIGASIGIVHCPHDGTDANLLMRRADVAMYQAKKNDMGYTIYNAAMDSQSLFELTIEAEINRAMDNGNFQLHYQPKIDMRKNCIAGAEALLRWKHPEHGMIPPDQFIPLAEKSGTINKVTRWVLQQALAQCAAWHDIGIKINVAVNLSAYSLKDNGLCDMISQALEEARVAPQYLTLELTESAIMSDASAALKTLIQIDAMGVRLSVDDFGTGYSSLAYLKRLPVDEIKIDKSFVMDMTSNASDAVIVRSTIDLAHNMGMAVVAEGIESQKIMDALRHMNCDVGQGYFLSKPVPAAELQQWLAASPWQPTLAVAN
jgi:diguanylate cyclase (GGDEF)-like protein